MKLMTAFAGLLRGNRAVLVQKKSRTMNEETRLFVETLITQKEAELKAFLQRRLPTATDAADAYQEVFLRMCRIEDPGRIENPAAFLFRTAANIVQDYYRRRVRAGAHADPISDEEPLPSDEPSPARALFAKEWWEAYCVAINELTPKCRRVFIMCRMQNYSHADIARDMGISTKMVEKYMTKALLHLRERLDEYLTDDGD